MRSFTDLHRMPRARRCGEVGICGVVSSTCAGGRNWDVRDETATMQRHSSGVPQRQYRLASLAFAPRQCRFEAVRRLREGFHFSAAPSFNFKISSLARATSCLSCIMSIYGSRPGTGAGLPMARPPGQGTANRHSPYPPTRPPVAGQRSGHGGVNLRAIARQKWNAVYGGCTFSRVRSCSGVELIFAWSCPCISRIPRGGTDEPIGAIY